LDRNKNKENAQALIKVLDRATFTASPVDCIIVTHCLKWLKELASDEIKKDEKNKVENGGD
jgi:hypothetical protein